ncbi:MAG: hypothetical protein HOW73_46820 [Polyangiaceae bacterium]|nr:hypothetical protein [Polyangiaceae bacterium]
MRKLQITLARGGGGVPTIVAAIVVPVIACDPDVVPSTGGAGGSDTTVSSSSMSSGGGGAGGEGFGGFPNPTTGGAGGGFCAPGEDLETIEVPLPPAGTPAEPGQICAAPVPVDSSGAARVTLMVGAQSHLATGFIAIAPEIAKSIIGVPSVEVIEATVFGLLPVTITDVAPMPGGFTFQASFPTPFYASPTQWASVTFRVNLTVDCGAEPPRSVHAVTYVQLCDELGGGLTWVSSGDDCNICSIIAEMAPSPIVPEKKLDELGLAVAIRLRIREIARVGRARVLFAENDAGADIDYSWRASGGEVTHLAPDVILWDPPREYGRHQVQAAIISDDGAAVSSFVLREAV